MCGHSMYRRISVSEGAGFPLLYTYYTVFYTNMPTLHSFEPT